MSQPKSGPSIRPSSASKPLSHVFANTSGHTGGEHVEGNLTADRVGETEVGEFLFEHLYKLGSATGLLVPGLKVVSFLGRGVTSDRGDVDHPVSEFDKRSPARSKKQSVSSVVCGEERQERTLTS